MTRHEYLGRVLDIPETVQTGLARDELRTLSGEKDGEPVTYWTFRLTRA